MNAKELRLPVGSLTLSQFAAPDEARRRSEVARAVVEGMACGLRASLEQATVTMLRKLATSWRNAKRRTGRVGRLSPTVFEKGRVA
jgi:uncharacterized protein (DUF1800 family)